MNLTNKLLIAPPSMPDERFLGSLVYITSHDENGAFGLIINQPIHDVGLTTLLNNLDIHTSNHLETPVLYGGPVRPEVGFVLHTGQPSAWHSSVAVTENICLTTSQDILKVIASGQGVKNYHVCLGHAAWQPNQLEVEMAQGDWHGVDADAQILFCVPIEKRYDAAVAKSGVKFSWLVDHIGHA